MPRYKKDSSRVLKQATRFIIPHNDGDDKTITATVCTFEAGSNYGDVKRGLLAVLKVLGLNRAEAKQFIQRAFPEVYSCQK